eukprot:gene25463-11219_t
MGLGWRPASRVRRGPRRLPYAAQGIGIGILTGFLPRLDLQLFPDMFAMLDQ